MRWWQICPKLHRDGQIDCNEFRIRLRPSMRPRLWAIASLASLLCACSQAAEEITPEVMVCATKLYPKYNPKDLSQCTAVCVACLKGVVTTCSTSCNLRGAR
jgi:hypothetical protein